MKNVLKKFKSTFLLVIFITSCSSDDSNGGVGIEPQPQTGSDISLMVNVDNESPYFGDNVTFTLTVTNLGPETATGVLVKSVLPSGYGYISDNGSTNGTYDDVTGVWTVPDISNGLNKALNITATVNETGDYNVIAEVIASDKEDPDSEPNNNDITEDDQDSVTVTPIAPSLVQVSTYATSVFAGDGLAIDSSGNLYATNYWNDIVYKIDTNQSVTIFSNNHDGAAGMVLDSNDNIYLARYEAFDIVKLDSEGNTIEVVANEIAAPIAVDFDSNGNIYTNNNVNNAITKIDPQGNKTIIPVGIYNNSSLTIDDDDNIYVSDYNSGIIKKIDAITNQQSTFVNLPLNNGSGIGFIIYSDGYFYATSIGDNTVLMIDSDGTSEIIAGLQGVEGHTDGNGDVATLTSPNAIVASEDGRTLYIVSGEGSVRKIEGFRED
ncbi:DUF11 domain-containing protein [Hanstruepera marina]|uniref:DUF11 domain-containing protein n=1 Tax=Hanstruepera marina TaxID=2873265 RepID=UPI001CA6E87B|nr:DUF11 domain-containing protein [Hanstruepera marina]